MKSRSWQIVIVLSVLLVVSLACNFSATTANIADAQMSRDEEGTQLTTTFTPEEVFYVNVDLQNAPDDTAVKAVWTAVQVEGTDPDTKIEETTIETGSGTVNFQLSNSNLWPAGQYKVDLYIEDKLEKTVEFRVE
jgi:hypothetical protein